MSRTHRTTPNRTWSMRVRRYWMIIVRTAYGRTIRRATMLVALGGLTQAGPAHSQNQQAFIITNATLIDGSGAPRRQANVRVRGNRIVEVGRFESHRDEAVVDALGLVLAPGFIDTHSHHDWGLLDEPTARAAVSQGITTIVVGQDGGAPFPLADFFTSLEQQPTTINVASYAGHNTLRRSIMGEDFRRPATAVEIRYMRLLLQHELSAGALGLSTGLEYDPGIYATTDEVLDLATATAAAGGRYISHIRSEDRYFWDAVEEVIRIGREARLPAQISHVKLAMRGLWGEADRLLRRLDEARASGVVVTADAYPYPYWQSTMTVLFPARDFDNREAAEFVLAEIVPPEGVLVARYEPEPSYVGKTLAEVASLRGSDAVTTLMALIAEARAIGAEESIIATSMADQDIAKIIAWPHTNVCSDGALDGRHPRGFGAFPRVLGRYVREQGILTLEQAIHKMSKLAADHVGIANRGVIRPGAYADLVLFDSQQVIDQATPQEPHRTATGISRVWVNGTLVYSQGQPSHARPGRVIRRGDH